jgi:phosphoribosylformimino-5-aminoimidazole carboxamide ribotide isomerase
MIVIPAIDIRAGRVVRLTRGDVNEETVYSDSPLEVAKSWAAFGAELIHIVDLDGALEGKSVNLDIVKKIAKAVKTKIELGGGIRDEAAIQKALDTGVDKVVIGTKALDDEFLESVVGRFKDDITVAIDAYRGVVRARGWIFKTEVRAPDLAKKVESFGVKRINYTDISRDGTLEGPNIKSLERLVKSTGMDIVAAGGVSTVEDIKRLKRFEKEGLAGVIIGKALYEHTIDLKEAMRVCKAP